MLMSLVFFQQENFKKSKRLMKVVDIDEKNLRILQSEPFG